MKYKNFACINVAIIGEGKVSEALAYNFALADHNVLIGVKNDDTTISDYILEEFENISLATIEYAASAADVIIIATAAADVREAAYLLDDVRNKVIIDMSGFSYSGTGSYLNTASAIQVITGSSHVVKCYCDNYKLFTDLFTPNTTSEMFVAGNSKKAKQIAKLFAKDMGFAECYDLGDTDNIPSLDVLSVNKEEELITEKKIQREYVYARK